MNPRDLKAENFIEGTEEDRLKFFVAMGVLAPSPYNCQPWEFLVDVTNKKITLSPNKNRVLKYADPGFRGLCFTFGAVLANIELAARSLGINMSYKILSTRKNDPKIEISFLSLEPASQYDSGQIERIKSRHNNRFAFKQEPIPDGVRTFVDSLNTQNIKTFLIEEKEMVGRLQKLTLEAVKVVFGEKAFTKELSYWLKPSVESVKAGMPGYILGIPKWFSFVLPIIIRFGSRSVVVKTQQQVHARWFDQAQVFGFLGIPKEERIEDILEAGMAYEKLGIEAQKYGIVMGAMSALVEAPGFAKKTAELLSVNEVPIMMFRIGQVTVVPPESPRLALEEVVKII